MKRPNILIFMTDHQRADTVLPEHPCITPRLDTMAAEGVLFENTFCPSPHCCPSRATFFTGLYPSRHGVWNNIMNQQALSHTTKPGVGQWSDDLKTAGYNLAFSGKWHVSIEERPADHGWHELVANAVSGELHGQKWELYKKVAEKPDPTERGEGEILRPGYETYTTYGTRDRNGGDENVVKLACEALPELAADDKPWVLYVGVGGPHDPYFVPQRYLDMYNLDDVPLPPSYTDDLKDKPNIYRRLRNQIWGQMSDREYREAIRHFWAYCTYLDDLFGQCLDALDATGQADDTLVIYNADHGDYCGDHGLWCKGVASFEGAYHVPTVMRWPNGIKNPGRRVTEFVSLADYAPTFQDLAGCDVDTSLTGASLVPFLRGETPANWRDDIHTQLNGVELYYTQRSVQTKDYKYVFNGFDFDELYDLSADPHEMKNLAEDPAYTDVKNAMAKRMWKFALKEDDQHILNSYITVGLAPRGPAEAFR